MYEKAMEILRWLGDQIGEGAEHFWPVIVREQWIEALPWLSLPFFMAGLWWILHRTAKKINSEDDRAVALIAINIVCPLVLLGCMVVFCGRFPQFFNPEYHAMQDVLEMIKP